MKETWIDHPFSLFQDALSSIFGRIALFLLASTLGLMTTSALASEWLWPWQALIYLPLVALASLFTGWGIAIYPFLFLLALVYIWKELPHWINVIPFVLVLWDSSRLIQAF